MITKQYALDLAERAAMTFLQAFLAVFAVTDLSTARGAALAGVAAVLALVKGLVASQIGDRTAALLPSRTVTE